MKTTCIIDASSYINLNLMVTRLYNLFILFSNNVTIKFSKTVKNEIMRYYREKKKKIKIKLDPVKLDNHVHKSEKYPIKTYEKKLFNKVLEKDEHNLGEKHNLAIIIDLFLINKNNNLIYIIDDFASLRGCLNPQINSFPIYRIWNSLDVVLFVYIFNAKKGFTYQSAYYALRDLNQINAPDNPQTDPAKTQKRIQRLIKYIRFLDHIRNFIER